MNSSESGRSRKIRFGAFEFDRESRQLTRHGTPVRIQDQPAQVLAALIANPGEVISREELQRYSRSSCLGEQSALYPGEASRSKASASNESR